MPRTASRYAHPRDAEQADVPTARQQGEHRGDGASRRLRYRRDRTTRLRAQPLTGATAGADIVDEVLGQEPPRLPQAPRGVALVATVAVVLGGGFWLTSRESNDAKTTARPSASPSPTPTPTRTPPASVAVPTPTPGSTTAPAPPAATPDPGATDPAPSFPPDPPRFVGPAAKNTGAVLLSIPSPLFPNRRAGVFDLDTGKTTPVPGLPTRGCLLNVLLGPTPGSWAAVWHGTETDGEPCAGPGRLYTVDAKGAAPHQLVAPGEYQVAGDRGSIWMVFGPAPAGGGRPVRSVQLQKLTGTALGPKFPLPASWTIVGGLGPDLVLLGRDEAQKSGAYMTWRPSTRKAIATYDLVMGFGAGIVVSTVPGCNEDCRAFVSAGPNSPARTVTMPPGTQPIDAAIRADGRYLAFELSTRRDASEEITEVAVMVVDRTTGKSQLVRQSTTRVGAAQGFLNIAWSSRWLMITAPGPEGTRQVAAYDPATAAFVVSRGLANGEFALIG